jgi:uncharacterized protein (TIGR03084 family)
MAIDFPGLLEDLAAESAELDARLVGLTPEQWNLDTPAQGWTIADQVSHLAYFDDAATLSSADADRFRADADELMALGVDFASIIAARYRSRSGDELLAWFREARRNLLGMFGQADPSERLPWYGRSMSAASMVTARLMETWAHGQDIADALHQTVDPSMRLRHIAHLGVLTFGFSFESRGLAVPPFIPYVVLEAPDGSEWIWGDPATPFSVRGQALDFCRVVTQRRAVEDTDLVRIGAPAEQWLHVAQAFAGPPTLGPRSGPSLTQTVLPSPSG